MHTPISVIIADANEVYRQGLSSLLQQQPGFLVQAVADTGAALLQLVKNHPPGLVFISCALPDVPTPELCKNILALQPLSKVIVLTSNKTPCLVQQVIQAGASGYIINHVSVPVLFTAAQTINDGGTYYSPEITHIIKDMMNGRILSTMFSPRELEVIRAICNASLTSKQIGQQWHMSEAAVESCRRRILQKMGCSSVVGMVMWAVRMGIVEVG